jgi:hypothetical protein
MKLNNLGPQKATAERFSTNLFIGPNQTTDLNQAQESQP